MFSRASTTGDKPTAVLLGGLANTTSTARALGRQGVPVAVIAKTKSPALHSRYAQPHPVPSGTTSVDYFRRLLLDEPAFPAGSVVLPCEDAAIEFVANNRSSLSDRYVLDIHKPEHQLQLLDKQKTLELARQAGVGAPRSWSIRHSEDIDALLPSVEYPVLIKPIHTHLFQRRFKKKLFFVEDERELLAGSKDALQAGIDFMVCEFIPGPDSLLSSYYVYIDRDGQPVFELTKRTLRRSPQNFGIGSYHMTEWLPQTAEAGRRFLAGMGFQGLGNIEFKTDPRDGELKIIECNARVTGAQQLIIRSGLNIPYIVYRYLTENERAPATKFREFVTLWLPFEDFDAFRDLRAAKQLSPGKWLRSICRPHAYCYFDWGDLRPFFSESKRELIRRTQWLMGAK